MGVAEYGRFWKVGTVVAYKMGAFLDESEDVRSFCMVAMLAPVNHWGPFEDAWAELLREYEMDEFHMQECDHHQGFFEDWDNPADREAVAKRFRDLLTKNLYPSPVGVIIGVDLAAYSNAAQQFANTKGAIPRSKKPWLFAFRRQIEKLVQAQQVFNLDSGSERIGLIFDRKDEFAGRVADMVKMVEADPTFPLGTVAFDDSSAQPALQAADLVAWEMRKMMTDVLVEGTGPRQQTMELVRATTLSGNPRFKAERWDAEYLTPDFLAKFWQIPLEEDARAADTANAATRGRPSGDPDPHKGRGAS